MRKVRSLCRGTIGLLGLCFSFATPSVAQFIYDGPEHFISGQQQDGEYLARAQQNAAGDAGGNYIVVWDSYPTEAGEYDVFARRFAPDGSALAPTFQVNQGAARGQLFGTVAMAADGRFVVAWDDREIDDPYGNGPSEVGARLFDAAGNAVTGDLAVNTYTTGNQGVTSVAMAPDGRFVVLWESGPHLGSDPPQDGDSYGVFGQLYDATGAPVGSEFAVNDYTTGSQLEPLVAMSADGSFVVVWHGQGPGSPSGGVFARVFDSSAVPTGSQFEVDQGGGTFHFKPHVAADPDGSFVVVWEVAGAFDGDFSGILARRFDASGDALTSQFLVNTITAGTQVDPTVATHGDGTFSVLWEDFEEFYPSHPGVLRRFDADGSPLGPELGVDHNGIEKPSLVAFADGRAVVVAQIHPPLGTVPAGNLIVAQSLCDPASGCTPDDGCSPGSGAIKLRNVGVNSEPGNDALSITGTFTLPYGTTFDDFVGRHFARSRPMRIIVASGSGTVRSDDELTAAYSDVRQSGRRVIYKDRSGSANGFTFVVLRSGPLNASTPQLVLFKAKARGGTFPVVPGDEPIRVTVELADLATCGPQTFAPTTCAFDDTQTALACE
jgi:hypothetical protein